MPTDYQYRRDIVRFGEMLHSLGFIAATDGNLSVRLDENRILVTPTGMSKGIACARIFAASFMPIPVLQLVLQRRAWR